MGSGKGIPTDFGCSNQLLQKKFFNSSSPFMRRVNHWENNVVTATPPLVPRIWWSGWLLSGYAVQYAVSQQYCSHIHHFSLQSNLKSATHLLCKEFSMEKVHNTWKRQWPKGLREGRGIVTYFCEVSQLSQKSVLIRRWNFCSKNCVLGTMTKVWSIQLGKTLN